MHFCLLVFWNCEKSPKEENIIIETSGIVFLFIILFILKMKELRFFANKIGKDNLSMIISASMSRR